jgi:hypothetical protein
MKTAVVALLVAIAAPAFAEEVSHFATEQECRQVKRKVDQTYATIQDYDGARLYMSGDKIVNIDCEARITNLSFNRWGYVDGAQFKSEPKMIVETRSEFNARLDRLVESRNSRDKFLNDRASSAMKRYGL